MKFNSPAARAALFAVLTSTSALTSSAFGQQLPPNEQQPATESAPGDADDSVAQGEVVVTGTLLRNPNLKQSTPVIATTADQIELKQSNVAEEVLRELPGVVANINSGVNNGNTGVSYVDLRGLGANRNIVLLDGHRIVPDDFNGQVDLNQIPLALVSRVDALTGAAVTTYGADAITGVVNFVTKRNFSGVEVLASEQITEKGDGNVLRVDATIGGNFADSEGNAVLSLGYNESDPVYQGARDFSVFQVNSRTGNRDGSGTSFPSRFSGTRGIDPVTGQPSINPNDGNGGLRQLDPATGRAVGTFQTFNFNPFNLYQTQFNRFNVFGQANYEVSDNIEIYARGMYSKTRTRAEVAPSGAFGDPVVINLNNPFLPAALRNQFCAANVAPVLANGTTGGIYTPRFTAAQCAAAATATGPGDPNYRTVTTSLYRRAIELGPRIARFQVDTFDIRLGARGRLTNTLSWDVNASHGESNNVLGQDNYVVLDSLRRGLRVGGTAANPVCEDTSNGCVPVDIFGAAGWSSAASRYLTGPSNSFRGSKLSQVQGLITGDLGWTIPSAQTPIALAVGAEYRNYSAYRDADLLTRTPGGLGGVGAPTTPLKGGYSVAEGFGEIIAPLLEDKPFFQNLTLEAGLRYSSYTVDAAGSPKFDTWTWKAGGSWEMGAGFKVRGNYNRASRAPNIGELFAPKVTGLTNLGVDPCAGAAPLGNANLRAICLAQGAPAGVIGSIANPSSAQANQTTEGNVNLNPERARTYTAGVVWQPEFVRGFNLSVDYYNIKITDAIGAPLTGDLVSACFGSITAASATNPDCTVIRRNPLTGGLDGSNATTPGFYAQQTNQGTLFTDGVDLLANYRANFDDLTLNLSFIGNWTNSSKFKASPSSLNRECAGYYSINCSFTGSIQPKWQFSQRTTVSYQDIDVSLLWRWIGKVRFEPAQFDAEYQGALAAPADCPNPLGADPGGCMVNPEFRQVKARSYFDLTTRYNVNPNLVFTFTVQNLFGKLPPILGNTIGTTTFNSGNTFPATYDTLGRRFAVSAKVRF